MTQLYAIRARIYPTQEQEKAFSRIAGCCRLVYNVALMQRSFFWRQYKRVEGTHINWFSQKRELTEMKKEAPFLSEAPAHCLQIALHNLDRAFTNFFQNGAKYPKPRKKHRHDSFCFPDPSQITLQVGRGVLVLPKFGKTKKDHGSIAIKVHRELRGNVRSVTIVREGSKWFASILLKVKRKAVLPAEVAYDDITGIDCGVVNAFTDAEGRVYGHGITAKKGSPRAHRKLNLERAIARCKKGSNRQKKAIKKLSDFYAREARQRRDMIEKASTKIANNHRVVVLEDLSVKAMTASAKGTEQEPGKNVAAKSGLNTSILDKGWGMFKVRLEQKLKLRGGFVLLVPAPGTSQECSACHHVDAASRVTQAEFACTCCGHVANADHNAAINIRNRGLACLGLTPQRPADGTAVAGRRAHHDSGAMKRQRNDGLDTPLPA